MTRNGDAEMSDSEYQEMLESIASRQQKDEVYRCAAALLNAIAIKHNITNIDGFECDYLKNLAKAMKWKRSVN